MCFKLIDGSVKNKVCNLFKSCIAECGQFYYYEQQRC